jgi:pyruvate/2-oxoglutarate dehydrogenase complex dihydrolipoamide acyltransferase (E2) component
MILRLAVPYIDHDVTSVQVGEWHVSDGDHIDYGQPLCDLYVDEVVVRRQFLEPDATFKDDHLFQAILDGRTDFVPEREFVADDFRYQVRVVSSDSGWMGRIVSPRSERRKIGELLALLTTAPDDRVAEQLGDDSETPLFRTVAEPVESGGDRSGAGVKR